MKCLITGGSGFIGKAMAGHLVSCGHTVWSASRREDAAPGCNVLTGDISKPDVAGKWLSASKPDVIIHLSAQSLPGVSWKKPVETFECNVNGTMNLLTAMKERQSKARFIMVSSSSVYAPPETHSAISETAALKGSSLYAWSKIAAEQAAALYGKHAKVDVVVARPFFIIGPRKTGDVSSDFARRIVAIERGQTDVFHVGNLEITRDFLDIQDAVEGFVRIIEKGVSGEAYNLSSGIPVTIRQLLDTFKEQAKVKISEMVNPEFIRPIDELYKVGNCTKLSGLDWSPSTSLETSVSRILEYWRAQP